MNKLTRLNDENRKLWEEYVKKHAKTRISHLLGFMESVEKAYKNCEDHYFFIKSKKIQAIFPFFMVKSKIFGNRLISVPFLDTGGFHGKHTSGDIKKIIKELEKNKDKIRYIEVRTNKFHENFEVVRKLLLKNNFKEEIFKQQFIINLFSEEEMWKKFHKHTRNDIRKAKKSGLVLKKIENKDGLKRFYKLYIREMRNFGTPSHSFKFFKNVFYFMKENVVGFNCYKYEKMIGSLIMFYHRDLGYISFNVSDRKYRDFRPNDLLYWEAIKWAIEKGLKYIDLGQVDKDSSDSRAIGLYKFKRKWLGDLYDRVYFYYSFNEEKEGMQEKKDKLKKLRKTWSKLPLGITKKLGPRICSELGI